MLEENGVRTWYGGVNSNSNKKIFNKNWGIDTTKYLNVTKFPSKKVITSAINLYIEKFRKPTHVVFCLDYSGSMRGDGENELKQAMNYILTYDDYRDSFDIFEFYNFSINFSDCTILNTMQNYKINKIASFDSDFDKIKGVKRIYLK